MNVRAVGVFLLVVLLAGVGWWVLDSRQADRGLEDGRRAFAQGDWETARGALTRYTGRHPKADEALLLLAQSWFFDRKVERREATTECLKVLSRISDAGKDGATARMYEGRIALLTNLQPALAEERLQTAIKLRPETLEAYKLLQNVYEVTDRVHLAGPTFWKRYEQTPPEGRGDVLTSWFETQFLFAQIAARYDEVQGFLNKDKPSPMESAGERLREFVKREPESAANVAALARWTLVSDVPSSAFGILEDALREHPDFGSNQDFVATHLRALLEERRIDDAAALLDKWPGEKAGYDYWRSTGIVAQVLKKDAKGAIAAYKQAISEWPGSTDLSLLRQLSQSLEKAGEAEEAKGVRERAAMLAELLVEDTISKLHRLLTQEGGNEKTAAVMVDFYSKLGCEREAKAWGEYREWKLKQENPAEGGKKGKTGAGAGKNGMERK